MAMKKILLALAVIFSATSANAEWHEVNNTDSMTNVTQYYLQTQGDVNRKLPFPYHNAKSKITYDCHSGEFYFYISADNLTGGDIGDGYHTYDLRVKFDDVLTEQKFIKGWNNPFLSPNIGGKAARLEFAKRLKDTKEFLLEYSLYNTGSVVWTYDMSGFDETKCKAAKTN